MSRIEEKPTYDGDKALHGDLKEVGVISNDVDVETAEGIIDNIDGLHRKLSNRQIQWIAIGGSIGTALFVTIAWGLIEGGPGSLLLGFAIYSCMLALVNSTIAECTVYMPVSGGFVRLASHWVDDVCIAARQTRGFSIRRSHLTSHDRLSASQWAGISSYTRPS